MGVLVDRRLEEQVVAETMTRLKARAALKRPLQIYEEDPIAFAHDCIEWPEGEGITDYQEAALDKLVGDHRLSLRAPHGVGKSAIAAISHWWFATTRDSMEVDWKIPTTAGAWRQLTFYLWPEIHKWARRLKWKTLRRSPLTRDELLTLGFRGMFGESFAVASNRPDLIEGAHASEILYIMDECKSIPPGVFDSVEGAFSGAGEETKSRAFVLSLSTPGEPQGRFYEIQTRKSGLEDWSTLHVTRDEALRWGRMGQDWADRRLKQWGKDSPLYKNRVLGEFAESHEYGIIPLAWVEAANERWFEWESRGRPLEGDRRLGMDVGLGSDKSVIAPRVGSVITELLRYDESDTMILTGYVANKLRELGGSALIDIIGVGAGVVHRTSEIFSIENPSVRIEGFNAAEGTDWTDITSQLQFKNKRAAGWWNLRDMLNPANTPTLALPPDDILTNDLITPRWEIADSRGRIKIEEKSEIYKRLERSTDVGDAVMMACWSSGTPTVSGVAVDPPPRKLDRPEKTFWGRRATSFWRRR